MNIEVASLMNNEELMAGHPNPIKMYRNAIRCVDIDVIIGLKHTFQHILNTLSTYVSTQ